MCWDRVIDPSTRPAEWRDSLRIVLSERSESKDDAEQDALPQRQPIVVPRPSEELLELAERLSAGTCR